MECLGQMYSKPVSNVVLKPNHVSTGIELSVKDLEQ